MIDYSLYVILGSEATGGRPLGQVARQAIDGGATILQLREKKVSALEFYENARRLRELTRSAGIPLIINDRVDIALAIDADGVHLGVDDLPLGTARRLLGNKIIGISAGTVAEAQEFERGGADYIGVGAIFATLSKSDAGAPIGVAQFKEIAQSVHIPAVGIGGIMRDNAAQVIAAGGAGVAVISAVVGAPEVTRAARELVGEIVVGRELRRAGK